MLAHHLKEHPAFPDEQRQQHHADQHFNALAHAQGSQPVQDTQLGRDPAQDEDDGGHGGQHQIAHQGGPASGSRMQLPETVTVRLSSLCQVIANARYKEQEQDQGSQSAPPC